MRLFFVRFLSCSLPSPAVVRSAPRMLRVKRADSAASGVGRSLPLLFALLALLGQIIRISEGFNHHFDDQLEISPP